MNTISTATAISDDKKTASFSISVVCGASERPVAFGTVDLATGRVLSLLIGSKDEVA
ncbi:hypothetical protein PY793_04480 [Acetobacter fabarum]|uniref:hypothetical protein n=1 Tax=Acetobacter fabarum TaxID=483199 RepID=UPI00312B3DD5